MNQITLDTYKNNKPAKSKYRAIPAIVDGIRFHSKKEAAFYQKLKILREHGDIRYFLMQVPFRLPGNVRYLCDFMIVSIAGTVSFIDVKGKDTPLSILKIKQVHDIYGIEIKIV
jgi:hypothetical protein